MPTEEEEQIIERHREKHEDHVINTFHDKEVHYREYALSFIGTATIETDAWGVRVEVTVKGREKPFSLAGRWDVLSISETRMAALYVNWSIERLSTI
jgi:hypothetical protein